MMDSQKLNSCVASMSTKSTETSLISIALRFMQQSTCKLSFFWSLNQRNRREKWVTSLSSCPPMERFLHAAMIAVLLRRSYTSLSSFREGKVGGPLPFYFLRKHSTSYAKFQKRDVSLFFGFSITSPSFFYCV